jgi:hypothetical protein
MRRILTYAGWWYSAYNSVNGKLLKSLRVLWKGKSVDKARDWLQLKHFSFTVKYDGGSIIVCGWFSYLGVVKRVFTDLIMDSVKYFNIISTNIQAYARSMRLDDFIFQQDNDPKRSPKLAKKYFGTKNINL